MRLIVIMSFLLFFITFNSSAQLLNGGFESWYDSAIYETPVDWNSSNEQLYYTETTVFKSTDAQEGNYAAELTVKKIFNDTVGGYVLHGGLNPIVGIPYTDNFEAVAVNYKIDLQPNDSLYLVVIRKNNGSIVDYHLKPFAFGPATSWTAQLIPVGNPVQDELLIGFIIGDPNTNHKPHPDSWALVDDIKLINGGLFQSDLPNYNFENWEDENVEIPDEWQTISPYLARFGVTNVTKTTDAFEGSYAIEMNTIELGGNDIAGIISKGRIDFESTIPFAAVPIASTPINLAGAYKYTTTSADEGAIQIQFFDDGALVGFHEEIFTPNVNYTIFNAVIGMFGTPDSMIYTVNSGENVGSVLKLDALSFDSDLSIDNHPIIDFTVSPNPADDFITVQTQDETFEKARILNVNGEIVWETNAISMLQNIDVSTLQSGVYFISLTSQNGSSMKKVAIR